MANALCNAIYPSSLYIMQGCLEGLVCVIILVISKGVAAYIASILYFYFRMVTFVN